jgi:hypothetical protein
LIVPWQSVLILTVRALVRLNTLKSPETLVLVFGCSK